MDSKIYNKSKGDIGENIAKNYLNAKGYKIIKVNFKNTIGEIDIIAYDGDVLVFVEVKYRRTSTFGLPREAVNYNKQKKIKLVATSYIKKYRLFSTPCRFDVIEILADEITHIENAF